MNLLAETSLPTDVIREPGFADWIVYLLVFLIVADRLKAWFVIPRREISGSIETKESVQHAEQSDLDELTKTVNSMREEITAQFRAAQTAGESRVAAITTNMDDEIRNLATKISNLAGVLHEKINAALLDNAKQGSDISHLQTETYRHTNEIAAIRTAIQELLKTNSKFKH